MTVLKNIISQVNDDIILYFLDQQCLWLPTIFW